MWEVITETLFTEENHPYTAYGIRCGECSISDICLDEGEIRRFADKLNELKVSPVHAYDVVEDFLAGGLPNP